MCLNRDCMHVDQLTIHASTSVFTSLCCNGGKIAHIGCFGDVNYRPILVFLYKDVLFMSALSNRCMFSSVPLWMVLVMAEMTKAEQVTGMGYTYPSIARLYLSILLWQLFVLPPLYSTCKQATTIYIMCQPQTYIHSYTCMHPVTHLKSISSSCPSLSSSSAVVTEWHLRVKSL